MDSNPILSLWQRLNDWRRSPVLAFLNRPRMKRQIRELLVRNDIDGVAAFGKCAVKPLISMLGDKDFRVQGNAVIALIKLGDTKVVSHLVPVRGNKGNVAKALVKLGMPAVRLLTSLLGNKKKWIRWNAVTALEVIIRKCSMPELWKVETAIKEGVRLLREQKHPSDPQECARVSKALLATTYLLQILYARRTKLLPADTTGLAAKRWKPPKPKNKGRYGSVNPLRRKITGGS